MSARSTPDDGYKSCRGKRSAVLWRWLIAPLLCLWLMPQSAVVWSAGGVVGEAGSCMIEIGLYTAHFTVYQSETRGDSEFCEDLPDTGPTLFVLDYLHGSMKEVGVDFRIIRDDDDWGIFTRWENIAALEDLDARTVFYQPAAVFSGNQLLAEYDFQMAGDYIGIVTAPHPDKDIMYRAVFPFAVAKPNHLPWLALLAFALLLGGLWWRRIHAQH
ncbi:hypothetical protein EYC98_13950 [Halieaceae bacterium IMCC14734]|uniref:Uncharacterized protein n=1 Tax=Candidatus Litorirhabdus singularis TaxID=2518993 RepID=A0ABT3TJK9_9GAMM|nr:hypothetical protein [Candidatus Litorirhabdus singularis]MCX2981961.1 hypothetical protein [Candidatus Litorirhabdus singularis]